MATEHIQDWVVYAKQKQKQKQKRRSTARTRGRGAEGVYMGRGVIKKKVKFERVRVYREEWIGLDWSECQRESRTREGKLSRAQKRDQKKKKKRKETFFSPCDMARIIGETKRGRGYRELGYVYERADDG